MRFFTDAGPDHEDEAWFWDAWRLEKPAPSHGDDMLPELMDPLTVAIDKTLAPVARDVEP
jgi:hypothetical protein